LPRPGRHFDRLRGKTALVTGAGCSDDSDHVGTGAAIALAFGAEGAHVCVFDLDPARGERTRRRIAAARGEAIFVKGDVTSAGDCQRAIYTTLSTFGSLQVLVNNVGGNVGGGKLDAIAEPQWRSLLDFNLTSAFLMSKAAAPHLIRNPGSAIVNIASIAGLQALGSPAYGSSKAALIALTHELAAIYGRDGLRVNVIAPGHLHTPLVCGTVNEAGRERRRNIAPLGVEGDAWDVAAAAVFLASDESRFITSVCIPVDGGVTRIGPLAALTLIESGR
jgi:NAD(P)-dependent dehydrogenase (short-subunit alcohol dehydrogenase family)